MIHDGKETAPAAAVLSKARTSSSLLSAALDPSSIAIIGASDNPNKIGGRPILFLSRFGFRGRVYPINPNRTEVQGLRCYPDVAALPETPDLAVIATPGSHVPRAVEECAARGVRVAVVMASGYGETHDGDAIATERRMVETARAGGMRLVGPNSQGLANFGTGAIASFSTMFLEVPPMDGPVAIVSQSGMMSTAPYGLLRERGIGVRHAHATGNDADVTLPELALSVIQDPEVRLLLLYIESLRESELLARTAAIARERDVPVVAVKAGRSARGQAAARSHTGALANEDRVVDAFFRRHGIWRAKDTHELVGAAEAYLAGWRPKAPRVVVVSNSGASCVMAADVAEDVKLDLAVLHDSTVARLTAELPFFASANNPVDITAALLTDSALFGRILTILADDCHADTLLVALPVAGVGYDVPAFARAARDYAASTGRAVVVATPIEKVAAQFRAVGVPTFSNQTEAMHVLAQIAHHAQIVREAAVRGEREPSASGVAPAIPAGDGAPFLDEAESLAFLGRHGLPVLTHRVCADEDEAAAAYRAFGGSVAVKACSAAVPHKSDHGMVKLDVRGESDVRKAFQDVRDKMRAIGVDGRVIVAPMVTGRRELVLGANVDPVFGPVVMIGDGGRYVEAVGDVTLLLAPATAQDVRAALAGLRVAPILAGVRGERPFDVEALSDAAVRLSEVIAGAQGSIASIDMNPVMVGRQGEGVVIADALIERQQRRGGVRESD
jgi:acyl-CoA synthetase (NDP forming)